MLSVDESSSGPFAGERGRGCLRVFSDGRVVVAHWSRSGPVLIEKATGNESRAEATDSREHKLEEYEAAGLEDFLRSRAVQRLPESLKPPHRPIDFFETTVVNIPAQKGKPKQITTREYYVASLEEKSRYPPALIVLMEQIEEIERDVEQHGKPADPPTDCNLSK